MWDYSRYQCGITLDTLWDYSRYLWDYSRYLVGLLQIRCGITLDTCGIIQNTNAGLLQIQDPDIRIKIPDYPILISMNIEENYYSDIYKYLYILKHNIEINRYPDYISEFKKKIKNGNLVYFIPEIKNIIQYIFQLHKEDGHKGIASLRKYITSNNIYFEGFTYLIEYIVKIVGHAREKN